MNAAIQTLLFRIILVGLGAACLLGLVHAASMLALKVPLDPNEGWNAYFAQMAMTTGSPYPHQGGLLVNNYPPLSFYLIGELGRVFGDLIFVGRGVSLLALAVVAFGIAAVARRAGSSKEHGAFAAFLFVACLLLTSDYVGMNDPQLLGHALAIGAMIVALRTPRISRDMVISALLLTLAFFVKHNLVLLPLALSAWLLLVDRRHAVTFIASGVIFLLIGLGIFRDVFNTHFLQQISSARVYALENARVAALNWLPWAAVPIAGTLLLLRIGRRDQYAVFAVVYAAFSTAGGLVFSGGAGVDANVFFDADIALVFGAALLLDRLENGALVTVAAFLYAIPLVFLLRDVDGNWNSLAYWQHPLAQDVRVATAEISLLRSKRDPVLCEMLSLCYWSGKSAQVDVFNMDQRFRAGTQRDTELVRMIDQKQFSIIQLEALKPFPLPRDAEQAIMRNYKLVRSDDERVFLAPL